MIVALKAIFCIATVGVVSYAILAADHHREQEWDPVAEHLANRAKMLAHLKRLKDASLDIYQNGHMHGKAGFCLLRSPEDPFYADESIHASRTSGPNHEFCWVDRAYSDIIYVPYMGMEAPNTCVSIFPIFDRSFLTHASARQGSSSGLWEVVVRFDLHGIQALKSMIAPESTSGPYLDWYGLTRNASEPPTEMKVVLVADDVAYQPVSVTEIVNDHLVGVDIVVARDLQQQQAHEIASRIMP